LPGLLATHHLGKGIYYLAIAQTPTGFGDLKHVRVWNEYFLDHVSPQSQNFLFWGDASPRLMPLAVGADPGSRHGEIFTSGVPPWTFPLELAFFIPGSERVARVYLVIVDLAALALLAWAADEWVWHGRGDRTARVLTALSIPAIGSNSNVLTGGQNGLIIDAGLAASLMAIERPSSRAWAVAAGIGLAFAAMKPSSPLLFGLPLLENRRWLSVIVCGAILLAATLCGSWWVRVPVMMQMVQFERATLVVIDESVNLPLQGLLAISGLPAVARNVMGFAGLGPATVATLGLGTRHAPTLFGILAVISRLFTYHRAHDNVLLAFLLIALARPAPARGGSRWWALLWLCAGCRCGCRTRSMSSTGRRRISWSGGLAPLRRSGGMR
jgi:hypothetical protein